MYSNAYLSKLKGLTNCLRAMKGSCATSWFASHGASRSHNLKKIHFSHDFTLSDHLSCPLKPLSLDSLAEMSILFTACICLCLESMDYWMVKKCFIDSIWRYHHVRYEVEYSEISLEHQISHISCTLLVNPFWKHYLDTFRLHHTTCMQLQHSNMKMIAACFY